MFSFTVRLIELLDLDRERRRLLDDKIYRALSFIITHAEANRPC
jgi:hypothetical protein